ncbi:MAG: acyl-CoA dehydratase activase [Oscillospiraceae bacterium]|nr:acyl-CoA dehydratase activase [Oscillospiraceae bacterium]
MIIAGIDMGVQNTRAVIIKDNVVIGRGAAPTGGIDRPEMAMKAYEDALSAAGIAAGDVSKVYATGKGKFDVAFADAVLTETVAAARAARFYFPEATAVFSVGADETLAAALGRERLISEFVLNQKCSAGLGIFITYLARRLGMTMAQAAAVDVADACAVNDGCVVFAELDALSMMNSGEDADAIMAAAIKAVAVRAATVLCDLTAPVGDKVVLVGGFTQSPAFLKALSSCMGREFLVPDDAEFCGAVGAALAGAEAE